MYVVRVVCVGWSVVGVLEALWSSRLCGLMCWMVNHMKALDRIWRHSRPREACSSTCTFVLAFLSWTTWYFQVAFGGLECLQESIFSARMQYMTMT